MIVANLAKKTEEPSIFGLLKSERMKAEIAAALPRHITPERMIRMAQTAIRQTKGLAECTQLSLLGCLIESSQLGLEPNTPLGQAYLIPYKKVCTLIIGYKGMIALADRSGISISAEVIRENDHFEFSLGTNRRIEHSYELNSDRGDIIGAYAVGQLSDGRKEFKLIGQDEIKRAKSSSQSANSSHSPWKTDESSMVAKTAVRRLAPMLPLSPEFARAVEIDEQADRGAQVLDVPFEVVPEEAREAEKVEKMENQIEAEQAAMAGTE